MRNVEEARTAAERGKNKLNDHYRSILAIVKFEACRRGCSTKPTNRNANCSQQRGGGGRRRRK